MNVSALGMMPFLVSFLVLSSIQGALAKFTPYLKPGFLFDYDKPGQLLSFPVSSQCERIHLKWSRETNNTGPPPVAPYFLQVFTSTSSTPFTVEAGFGPTFDWDVPFAPNTQYQICMYDINGVSGGCQATYSVIPNTTVTTPTCQNVTAPPVLSVSGTVPTGALSQYSYIDQCTKLSVTPKSGTPPFILTVAPSFHPPYNLTSKTMDSISWLVSLPVGFHFFLSLTSADGQVWANGPMRVGDLGPTDCLAPGTMLKDEFNKIIIGTSIGSLVFGLAIGAISYLLFRKFRRDHKAPSQAYFAREYLSRDDPSRPLKAPSTIAFSTVASSSRTPTLASMPSTMSPTRIPELPDIPLEPRRLPRLSPNRHETQRSVGSIPVPYPLPVPPVPPSETASVHTQYPADVKIRPPDTSIYSRDDSASTASSSSNFLSPSSIARAPSYVRNPPRTRHPVYAINETEVTDQPPEYGRHTDDPSCTPSIISSGRF
ncbi:hypothetical protein B0H34DRAFT_701510 [Crassisporium funariophilum]|nr:hypothetical protein B0H34DRAFT_701510 [Crassisporium funariophilum]